MSCSKGSKGGGGWQSWPSQGGKGKARGKGKRHNAEPAADERMRGDRTYQKYLDAGDALGAIIYEVGGFFGRGGRALKRLYLPAPSSGSWGR